MLAFDFKVVLSFLLYPQLQSLQRSFKKTLHCRLTLSPSLFPFSHTSDPWASLELRLSCHLPFFIYLVYALPQQHLTENFTTILLSQSLKHHHHLTKSAKNSISWGPLTIILSSPPFPIFSTMCFLTCYMHLIQLQTHTKKLSCTQ